jgi:hypothetical protein
VRLAEVGDLRGCRVAERVWAEAADLDVAERTTFKNETDFNAFLIDLFLENNLKSTKIYKASQIHTKIGEY